MILFQLNDPWHFGSLHMTMLTLFRCATGEDWTDVMYINSYGCDKFGYSDTMTETGYACGDCNSTLGPNIVCEAGRSSLASMYVAERSEAKRGDREAQRASGLSSRAQRKAEQITDEKLQIRPKT